MCNVLCQQEVKSTFLKVHNASIADILSEITTLTFTIPSKKII